MVDGFPYKEEVGGSSPSVPTKVRQAFVPVAIVEDRQECLSYFEISDLKLEI